MAKLFFRYGAMNSGKSTALLQVAYNYEERGMNVVLIKAEVDTKGGDKIVSRLGVKRKVDVLAHDKVDLRAEVLKRHEKKPVACVLIDEANFITPKQAEELFELVVKDGIPVICYGLRSDFRMELFPGSQRLFALAHSIEELKTICRCGKKAIMNGRKINGDYVFEGSQVAIDGEDDVTYQSLCGKCYFEEKAKADKRNEK